jgi:molybdopterin-binding protein
MLDIRNISKDLGEFVLNDVSLKVRKGEYIIIIGPTGAGKTILLETIAGIYPPDDGQIILEETNITQVPPKDRKFSMVYQDYMLFPHLTVEENIGFGLKIRKTDANVTKQKVAETSDFLGIDHLLHRYPETLSGGEQQRAAIARALVMEPRILLLDEPLSALDGQTREKLRTELKRLHAHYGITVMHVTHNFEEVFSLADRVAVMNEGRIIQIGEPDEVFRHPNCEFIANFVGMENIFKGFCREMKEGVSRIDLDGLVVCSPVCIGEGVVYASVRPEEIILSKETVSTSARNCFEGTIVDIVNSGMVVSITVEVGIPFVSVLTQQAYQEMDLHEGDRIFITFKASSVHVF